MTLSGKASASPARPARDAVGRRSVGAVLAAPAGLPAHLFDAPMRLWQRIAGRGGMIAFFLAPNMAIFGLFVIVPLGLNVAYALSGGTALFLPQRPYLPLGTLLPRIRELGLAPVVEAADGTVRVARPDVFRARSRRRPAPAVAGVRSVARTAAVVTAIRAGELDGVSGDVEKLTGRPPTSLREHLLGALPGTS